jgi:hypothetical protein
MLVITMDLSDFNRSPEAPDVDDDAGSLSASPAWLASPLVGQLSDEIAAPLVSALARIDAVLSTGKLDRAGLNALRTDVDRARSAAEIGQRIQRATAAAASAQPRQIELGAWLREAVLRDAQRTEALGIEVRQIITPAQVMVDTPLLLKLLQAVLDWAVAQARSAVEFRLDMKPWPMHALLSCRFMHHPIDQAEELAPGASGAYVAASLDTLDWRLVQALASAAGVIAERDDTPVHTLLTLEFPRTVNERSLDTVADALDTLTPAGAAVRSVHHVLVLAARREVRNQVRESIRPMDLMIDYATNVEEAQIFCAEAPPQAVVYEAALGRNSCYVRWRDSVLARAPRTVFIEICEEGRAMEVTMIDGHRVTRVGRDAVVRSLPSALSFELSRQAGR